MKKRKYYAAMCIICLLFLMGCGLKMDIGYDEPLVVDVFDSVANYEGMQSGWFAKVVKDDFNMELNIIAPNVAGGGNTLFDIRSAAGNLGDLIICNGEDDTLQKLVNSGLVLNMEPYLKDKEIMRFEKAIKDVNKDLSPVGIYAIPSEVSLNSPMTPSEGLEPTYGPYLRWDLYKELGYPEINTLEDLLPILVQMQKLEPFAENGEKTYAFSFFKDWDGNMMNAAKQPCCFYGWDELGFLLLKADSDEYQSIIDSDSMYVRVLKWYFEANQLGLVDPQSQTQSYNDVAQKYEDGQVLYSPWPWVAQIEYNTLARRNEGKGFMIADMEDMNIYSYGCNQSGSRKTVILVGSHTKDPERLMDFVDWMYSSDGIRSIGPQSSAGTAGPEGLCWEYDEKGAPRLTEFGEKALSDPESEMPDEWGTGTWAEGISVLNFMPVAPCEVDEDGYPYAYRLWDSVRDMEETALEKDWKEVMQADNTRDFLLKNDKMVVSPGCNFTYTISSEIETLRGQCRSVIQKYSWEMIFAEDEAEFYQLLSKMQNEALSLGYDKVVEVDIKDALSFQAERVRVVEEYENDREQ